MLLNRQRVERADGVATRLHPHLHCAEFSDAVLDVVEGRVEEMELSLP